MITKETIQKLASLARMKLSTEEEEKLATDMEEILGYVQQIQEVSGTLEQKDKELNRNVLREDTQPHTSGEHTEALLAEAPEREGNYLKVKKILS